MRPSALANSSAISVVRPKRADAELVSMLKNSRASSPGTISSKNAPTIPIRLIVYISGWNLKRRR
jgi:hypothetical protein